MNSLSRICRPSTHLRRRNLTAEATARDFWQSIETKNASINAIVSNDPTRFVATNGPLANKAIAVKDNICTASMPTTCSSAMLRDFTSPFDATVVSLLKDSGAIVIGKTNCDEFGMGSLNVHSIHGPVVNPHQVNPSSNSWDARERRSAGGSSGGSAAAVAAGMCYAALGTDTGGSIRLPASYCGVIGLKPSYGLVSRWGVISFADSLDCVGVLAKDVHAVREVFGLVSKHDIRDPTSATFDMRDKAQQACQSRMQDCDMFREGSGPLAGLRIGIPQEYFPAELAPHVLQSIRRVLHNLKSRGATLVPVSLPSTSYALSAYYIIASAEASSNMGRYDGIQYGMRAEPPPGTDRTKTANVYAHSRSQGLGPEVQKRILLGTYALTADAFDNYFLQAQRTRTLVRADFDRAFRAPSTLSPSTDFTNPAGVDALIHPSAICTAPELSEPAQGLQSYVQDVLTVPASLAGLPALSVPAGMGADGWPVGVSLVGQWGHEEMLLSLGSIIESVDRS